MGRVGDREKGKGREMYGRNLEGVRRHWRVESYRTP